MFKNSYLIIFVLSYLIAFIKLYKNKKGSLIYMQSVMNGIKFTFIIARFIRSLSYQRNQGFRIKGLILLN